MLVAVVGGKLQGVEAAYLAHKAGWEVLLLDRKKHVPASGLCDRFVQVDVTRSYDPGPLLDGVDFILPALENDAALSALRKWSDATGVPLAFDPAAYAVSSSKHESDRLFAELGLPAPLSWPGCAFPVIIKPDSESGSHGVKVVHTPGKLSAVLEGGPSRVKPVVQEYLSGPSYSIEVIGTPGRYLPLQVTALHMDAEFDCKRVTAPADLPPHLAAEFEQMAVSLAEALQLKGVMDLEVIVHNNSPKLLEIDARLPSQTPTVVYWSTGINLVALLGELATTGKMKELSFPLNPRVVLYEHIRLTETAIETAGERIVSEKGPLHVQPGFFGADEALTNFSEENSDWVATLIFTGATVEEVMSGKMKTMNRICQHAHLTDRVDTEPDVMRPEETVGLKWKVTTV